MKNPLSLEAFADWCAKQPTDAEYRYDNIVDCACGRYFRSLGIDAHYSGYHEWLGFYRRRIPHSDEMDRLASVRPHTFGALTERVRGAIAARKVRQGV